MISHGFSSFPPSKADPLNFFVPPGHELQTRDEGIGNSLGGLLALVVIDLATSWMHPISLLQGHHCYLGNRLVLGKIETFMVSKVIEILRYYKIQS